MTDWEKFNLGGFEPIPYDNSKPEEIPNFNPAIIKPGIIWADLMLDGKLWRREPLAVDRMGKVDPVVFKDVPAGHRVFLDVYVDIGDNPRRVLRWPKPEDYPLMSNGGAIRFADMRFE